MYGAVLGLRAVALILCGALYTAAVDPDEVLRLFRRVSFRSALTATIGTRMVPVLVRDSRRLADAQRCRPGRPPSRAALMRAATAGLLDRALDVAAALEVRGYGGSRRPPRVRRPYSRHDLAFAASSIVVLALAIGGRAGGLEPFRAYPALWMPLGAGEWALAAALLACALLPFAERRGVRPVSDSVLELEQITYSYPGAASPAIAEVTLRIEPGRAGGARRRLGVGEVDAAAGRQRAGSALSRRDVRRARGGRGARHARAWSGRSRHRGRLAVPGPRDAGRDGDRSGGAGVPAREPRLDPGGGRARGRGGRARARHRAPARALDDRAVAAASSSASRSPRRSPATRADPARRADLAARPCRRGRADRRCCGG